MKTNNQEMIQELMNEGEYSPLYPFVLQSKLSDFQKILVSLMLNDIRMNGTITWKHQTYADKLLKSRKGIWDQFRILTELGIIIPCEDNKAGGKSNTFIVSFTAISDYRPVTGKNRSTPVTGENKPVTGENKPVTGKNKPVTGENKPVTQQLHINKVKETNKEINKEIIKTVGDKITSDIPSFFVIEEEQPIDDFLDSLETQATFKTNDIKRSNDVAIKHKDIELAELDLFLANLDF